MAEKSGGKFHSEESRKISGGCSIKGDQLINNNLNKSLYQSRSYHNNDNPHSKSYHDYQTNHKPLKQSYSNNTTVYTAVKDITSTNNNSVTTTEMNTPQSSIYANNETTNVEGDNSNR